MWWLKRENDGGLYLFIDGFRSSKKSGEDLPPVEKMRSSHKKDNLQITFADGKSKNVLREKFNYKKSDESAHFEDSLSSNAAFTETFKSVFESANTNAAKSNASTERKRKANTIDLDKTITKKEIQGTYTVRLEQLKDPGKDEQCRAIDQDFVSNLKDGILRSGVSSYVPVFPVNCISLQNKEDFNIENIMQYEFVSLGGNHLRKALEQLAVEDQERKATLQLVKIYVGLTAEESHRLANDHNVRTHFTRSTSFLEEAEMCRKFLKEAPTVDNKTYELNKNWRQTCQLMLCRETQKLQSLEPMFQVAGYSKRCFELCMSLHTKYKKNGLKGQKIKEECKPLSQTPFLHLQGLSEEEKFQLLKKINEGDMSLKDMMRNADLTKKKRVVKTKMMQYLIDDVDTWEEAVEKYPLHTKDSELTKLCRLSYGKQTFPEEFIRHCERAKIFAKDGAEISTENDDVQVKPVKGLNAYVVNRRLPQVFNGLKELFKENDTCFIHVKFDETEHKDKIKQTVDNVISFSENGTLAFFGTFPQLDAVMTSLEHTDLRLVRIFQYSNSLSKQANTYILSDCVSCGLICFKDCAPSTRHGAIPNMWHLESKEFKLKLMAKFTKPGDWFVQSGSEQIDQFNVEVVHRDRRLIVFCSDFLKAAAEIEMLANTSTQLKSSGEVSNRDKTDDVAAAVAMDEDWEDEMVAVEVEEDESEDEKVAEEEKEEEDDDEEPLSKYRKK